jgi:hypothetical protein
VREAFFCWISAGQSPVDSGNSAGGGDSKITSIDLGVMDDRIIAQ